MPVVNGVEISTLEIPVICNTMTGRLLVIGGAGNYLDDLKAYKHHDHCHYMAINDQIERSFFPIQHAVSMHGDCLTWWTLLRRSMMTMMGQFHTHCHYVHSLENWERYGVPECIWETKWTHGSSSLLGVIAGLAMGYDEIVLAGIPLDTAAGHHFTHVLPHPYECFLRGWEEANQEVFAGRVKSLSGKTRELLGGPKGH